MVDIEAVSVAVASASVFIAAIYYIFQIRLQTRTRQTELVMRMYSYLYSDDYRGAILKVLNLNFKDYDDFVKKYGPYLSESTEMKAITKINVFYEGIASLLYWKLVDAKLIYGIFHTASCRAWEKVRPIIEGYRKASDQPRYLWPFEYLYNEMKKREQQLASKTA